MINGLVSVISACYNKAPYLERFVRSIIKQDYRPIELIMVDDGSTDTSWSILQGLELECKAAGISTFFFQQENLGVGYAINNCLEKVRGEYLCWPDCDDWLEISSVSKRVQFLRKNKQYSIVTSNANVYREEDIRNPIGLISTDQKRFDDCQYELLLNGKSIVCPGCHMVKTDVLFCSMGGNKIYPSRYGQNLQLLFPILYHSKRGFIDEPLYNYMVYNNSLSHYQRSFEKQWAHREGRYQIKIETIGRIFDMNETDKKHSLKVVCVNEARYRLELAQEYGKTALAKEQIVWLLKLKALRIRDLLKLLTIITKKT